MHFVKIKIKLGKTFFTVKNEQDYDTENFTLTFTFRRFYRIP